MKNLMIATAMMTAAGLAPAASTTETALQTIESALQSKNPNVRKSGVEALGIAGTKYQTRLEQMLDDKDAQVRFAAAKSLYEMGDDAGERVLLKVLTGDAKAGFVAQQKREAMNTMESPKSATMVAVRGAAALVPVPGVGLAVSMTTKAIKNKTEHPERAASALLLGKTTNPEVIAALEKSLTDKDPSVRAAAIQALAMTEDASLAGKAEPMLNDKNRTVRLRAAAAWLKLSSIEPDDSVE